MSEPCPVDSEGDVTIAFQRVAVRIELEIHAPELVSGIEAKTTEDREECDTGTETHLREGIASRERTQNVGGD